jgi:hypothetical protein
MAEHSMCQPGRPFPQALSHLASSGSVSLAAFHSTKVERVFLAVLHRHALAGAQLVQRLARQLAVARELAHRVVHVAMAAR